MRHGPSERGADPDIRLDGGAVPHPHLLTSQEVTDDHPAAAHAMKRGRSPTARVCLIVTGLAAAWALVALYGTPDLDRLQTTVRGTGPWAPVAFVVGYASLTLLPTPRNVLTVLGAALFGLPVGIGLAWASALLGAVVAFGIGRLLGRDAAEHLTRGRLERMSALLRDHGVGSVLTARLIPVLPFTAINYACGILGVRLSHFVIGSAIGTVPGTLVYAALGAYGGTDPWVVGGLVGAALVLLGGGGLVGRRACSARAGSRATSS